MKLTENNFRTGFLVTEEYLGGVTESEESLGCFNSFIVNNNTGEYVFFDEFKNLEDALATINQLKPDWEFESTHEGCKGSACGPDKCKGSSCKLY